MISIYPYCERDGVRTISDSAWMQVWHKLEEQGIAKIVFSDGTINTPHRFLDFIKEQRNLVSMVLVDDVPGGFGWVNGIAKNHAFAHYAFFRETWGKQTDEMAHALVSYWFDTRFPFDILIGQTPEWNRKAVRFLSRIGWTVVGTIPLIADGKGMVVSYITREGFNGKGQGQQ